MLIEKKSQFRLYKWK